MILEICVDSYESLLAAKDGGADRIELCSVLEIGGLTPSPGLIEQASKLEGIEVFAMIRPRSGDFFYNCQEIETMKAEIDAVKSVGLDGIVFGIVDVDGYLDTETMKEIIDYARPLRVAIHRAFDVSRDDNEVIEKLIDIGFERILSSGKRQTSIQGADFLADIQDKYGDRIQIMPGGGITSSNIRDLYEKIGCDNFHMSAKKTIQSELKYRSDISFSASDFKRNVTDQKEVERVRKILDFLE